LAVVDKEFARWLADRDPEADWATATQVAERLAPMLVGLSLSAATQLAQEDGVILRIGRGEGAPGRGTRDRRPNRVNVHVQHGTIVTAEVY
jgi:hypothetical protein